MNANRSTVTPMGSGPDLGLPPAALARHADGERRRELARALHAPHPRARRITAQLEVMRNQIALYRVQAIAIHARLLELEAAGNDNIAVIRRALIESSVRIESVARTLVDTPPARWPRGTEQIETTPRADSAASDDWADLPTLRRLGDEWPDEPTLRRAR